MRIPLTLSILEGATFRIGDITYSVPASDLVTFQRMSPEQIVRIDGHHRGFRLWDQVVPLVEYGSRQQAEEQSIAIVLRNRSRTAALVADQVYGYQQFVVRPVPEYVRNMPAVSGCTIQGDGGISLILDVGELISMELDGAGVC
jgi:two-component system chemotaxis sensor kinase CheA